MDGTLNTFDSEADRGDLPDLAGAESLLEVEPEDGAVAVGEAVGDEGTEDLIDLISPDRSVDGFGAVGRGNDGVEVGGFGVLLAEGAAAFEGLFVTKLVVRDVGREDFEVANDGVGLARLEVAKKAAAVYAETKERLLDEVIHNGRRVNVPAAGGTEDGQCNRALEPVDEFAPCGFASRFAANAG